MNKAIEIRDRDSQGLLAVTLPELLTILQPLACSFQWRLYQCEAVGDVTSRWSQGIVALGEQVDSFLGGMPIEWGELESLAALLTDVWNLHMEGTAEEGRVRVVVRIMDSTACRVESSDVGLLQRLTKRYRAVQWV